MKRQYSLVDNIEDYDKNNTSRKHKRLHKPELKDDAKTNSVGSYSSITTTYNNVYK